MVSQCGPESSRFELNTPEKAYISNLNIDDLLDLLGPRYAIQFRPRDRASLLFALLSGKSAPVAPNLTRYRDIVQMRPNQVWRLARSMYNILSRELELASLYPPYLHVAQQPRSDIETIIVRASLDNVDELIQQHGIVWADGRVTDQNKLQYFFQEISKYERVLSRRSNFPILPALSGSDRTLARDLTSFFTLRELVDGYEPIGRWGSREELVDVILAEANAGPMWSYRVRYGNNDETFNPIYYELHRDIDKLNPLDPTISYGRQRNYRCYQVSELTGAFSFDADGFMHFNVPDYQIPNSTLGTESVIDLTTGQPLLPEFSITSIQQLQTLLRHPPAGYKVDPLLEKVNAGLAAATAADFLGRKLRQEYLRKPESEQYLIRLYLAWLFAVGMWQRFWSGPGHPWPVAWIENEGIAERVDFRTGEEHGFIQNSVHTTIIETYENPEYPGLKEWIEAFPIVDYNFQTQEVKLATGSVILESSGDFQEATLKSILDESKLGLFCTAHSSRLLIGTSYFLIAVILGFSSLTQFNQFLEEMLPALDEVELDVVNFQLEHFKDPSSALNRYQVLIDRQTILTGHQTLRNQGISPYVQPPFQPAEVTHTGHTDPQLGRQLQFVT